MDRKAFGKLVAALREEQRDSHDLVWTQNVLAQRTGISVRTIGAIERGERAVITEDELVCLADALELTSAERQVFFAAASGVPTQRIARPTGDAKVILAKKTAILAEVQTPACIADCLTNLIAVNSLFLHLFPDLQEMAAGNPLRPTDYNLMRYDFSHEALFKRLMGPEWLSYATGKVMLFRAYSMRYRTDPAFLALFTDLRRYSMFRQAWRLSYWEEQDQASGWFHFQHAHSMFGSVSYYSNSTSILTPFGELLLTTYLPADLHTTQALAGIPRTGKAVHPLAPWPAT